LEAIAFLVFAFIVWLTIAVATGAIAEKKKRNAVGWFLGGLYFGPIALLLAIIMQRGDADETQAGEQKGNGTEQVSDIEQNGLGRSQIQSESLKISPTSGQSIDHGETMCPMCRETIKIGALKCKHCGELFSEPVGMAH
jgi:hypothetical protein